MKVERDWINLQIAFLRIALLRMAPLQIVHPKKAIPKKQKAILGLAVVEGDINSYEKPNT